MIGRLLPILIFVLLGILLAVGLRIADHKTEIPSPLIGKPLPPFELPVLGQPERVLTNDDLAKLVDTNDEWIVRRTGIHELLVNNETMKSLIYRQANAAELKEQALKDGMRTLMQDGIRKLLLGQTDLTQIRRVAAA